MLCHTPPPFPDWRSIVNKLPLFEEMPFSDLDDDEFDPSIPEPPEYGPVHSVIIH